MSIKAGCVAEVDLSGGAGLHFDYHHLYHFSYIFTIRQGKTHPLLPSLLHFLLCLSRPVFLSSFLHNGSGLGDLGG